MDAGCRDIERWRDRYRQIDKQIDRDISQETRWSRFNLFGPILQQNGSLYCLHICTILGDPPFLYHGAHIHPASDDFYLSTRFEDSDMSYGDTWYYPFQGPFQVNLVGPGVCLCIISFFIKLLHKRGHSILLRSAISHQLQIISDMVSVDDTYLPSERDTESKTKQNLNEVAYSQAVYFKYTGNTLILNNSFLQLVLFNWTGRKWHYGKRTGPSVITVPGDCSNNSTINFKDQYQDLQVVGVWKAPNICQQNQLLLIIDSPQYCLQQSFQEPYLEDPKMWYLYNFWHMSSIQPYYSSRWRKIKVPLHTGYSPLGTNRNFPTPLIYLPAESLGLELSHPYLLQGIYHIKMQLRHIDATTVMAHFLCCNLDKYQL